MFDTNKVCDWLSSKLPGTTITVKGKSYLSRWYFFIKDRKHLNLFLHFFHSSDQKQELHSHPFLFGLSFVLSGGYYEERIVNGQITKRHVRPFTFNLLTRKDFHRVDLVDETKGAWTIFLAGPRSPDWFFMDRDSGLVTHYTKNPEAIP